MTTNKHSHKKPQRRPSKQEIAMAERCESILTLGADFGSRHIYLMDAIHPESTYRFIVAFQTLDSIKGDITVLLGSPGGSVSDGFAIYDAIRMAQNDVAILGTGVVHSIAALIFQAAKTRILTPECRMMVHNGSVAVGHTDTDTLIAIGKEVEQGNKDYQRILANRSGLPLKQVKRLCETETYFSAKEAVLHGFADAILGPGGQVLYKSDLQSL